MDLTVTIPGIIAVIALIAGGIYVPIRISKRNAQSARQTQLEPAFDELLQAIARIREPANTATMGLPITIPATWKADLELIQAMGNGRWPVKPDDTAMRAGCTTVLVIADRLPGTISKDFTRERLNQELSRHVKNPDDPYSDLFRLIQDSIENTVRRPIVGADLKKNADLLSQLVIERRDKLIEDG